MFSHQAAELSLNTPLPAVAAIQGDKANSRFLVGTSSVRSSEDNHIHMLRFYSEANQLGVDATLSHPTGPIQHIVSCPNNRSVLLTVAEYSSAATVWKIPSDLMDQIAVVDGTDIDYDDDDDDVTDPFRGTASVTAMEEQTKLQMSDNNIKSTNSKLLADVCWRGGWEEEPSSDGDVMTLNIDGTLTQWDVVFGTATETRNNLSLVVESSSSLQHDKYLDRSLIPRMSWDPHNADVTAVSIGTMVHLVDWREAPNNSSTTHHPYHRYGITDLDYNPNKPHMLVTSGKDGLVKFWDLRKSAIPVSSSSQEEETTATTTGKKKKKQHPILVARGGHRHWATRVLYNPFHDQLVLSAGTDSMVNLWRMSTISSAPLVMLEEENNDFSGGGPSISMSNEGTERRASGEESLPIPEGPNVRVSNYEHLDAVMAITWSAADAWIYMSASYDGKVVVNHVPSKEKYKILL